jgi:hypothetical protein
VQLEHLPHNHRNLYLFVVLSFNLYLFQLILLFLFRLTFLLFRHVLLLRQWLLLHLPLPLFQLALLYLFIPILLPIVVYNLLETFEKIVIEVVYIE